jgi:hypothetical protein
MIKTTYRKGTAFCIAGKEYLRHLFKRKEKVNKNPSVTDINETVKFIETENKNPTLPSDEPKLLFLHCLPIYQQGLKDYCVPESKFKIMLSPEWTNVTTPFMYEDKEEDFIWRCYRFMGIGKSQWFDIEYIHSSATTDISQSDTIDASVALRGFPCFYLMEGGIKLVANPIPISTYPMLYVPEELDIMLIDGWYNCRVKDKIFIKKHGLDDMCAFWGVAQTRHDKLPHKIFIVTMVKGNDAWKLSVVFPTPTCPGTMKDDDKISLRDMSIAGIFIGNFSILDR